MAIKNTLAKVAVSGFGKSLEWHKRLFDQPRDTRPMDGLAEWRPDNGGWRQVFSDHERASPETKRRLDRAHDRVRDR